MGDLEDSLKEVLIFDKIQKKIFNENDDLLEKIHEETNIITEIKKQYLEELENIPNDEDNNIITIFNQIYNIKNIQQMIRFFETDIFPLKKKTYEKTILEEEFKKAKNYVLNKTSDNFLDIIQNDYYSIKYDKKMIMMEEFLEKYEFTKHIDSTLNSVFKLFINQVEEELESANVLYNILDIYLKDLGYLFLNPEKRMGIIIENFLLYIKDILLNKVFFKYHNNIEKYIVFIKKLDEFFETAKKKEGSEIRKILKEIEKNTFSNFKNFMENYNDKAELLQIIDRENKFINNYYKKSERQSIKIWIINIIENYLNNIKENNNELIQYGFSIYSFKDIKYIYFNKLFNNYFTKKFENFLENFYDDYLNIYNIQSEFDLEENSSESKIIQFYTNFFKKIRIHTDTVINNLKSIKIKEIKFRDDIMKKGIDKYLVYYHDILSNFLKIDLKIDKQKIFIYYGSDLKKILNEELLSLSSLE